MKRNGIDLNILSYGITDIGLKRKVNEDFYIIIDHNSGVDKTRELGQLFAVADGMGGHSAGDVASRMACETVLDYYDYEGKISKGYRAGLIFSWRSWKAFLLKLTTKQSGIPKTILKTTSWARHYQSL